jgi:hypothetical protein
MSAAMVTASSTNAGQLNLGGALDVNGVIRSNNLPKYWNYVRLYTGGITSTATYFLIGTMNDYAISAAGSSICINGAVGGWGIQFKSNINITLTTRGASATTIGVTGSMTSSATLSTILTIVDFVVYYQGGGGSASTPQYYVYLKTVNSFPWFDFTVTGNDQRADSVVLSDPAQGTTTVPSGTLLSGTPSILSALQTYNINGQVGIGIANPLLPLHVNTNTSGALLRLSIYTGGYNHDFGCAASDPNILRINARGDVDLYGQISLATNNVERLRITNTGNVGIGTDNPTGSTMQIGSAGILRLGPAGNAGNSVATGLETSRYQIAFSTYRDVVLDQIGAKIAAINYNNWGDANRHTQSTALAFFVNSDSARYGSLANYPTFSGTNTSGTTYDSSTEAMRIAPSGNVGIGTNNPQATLDVAGGIRATNGLTITGGTVSIITSTGAFSSGGYLSNAMTNPPIVNGIFSGTGDGVSSTTFNLAIGSWWGIGFVDTYSKSCYIYMDVRTGTVNASKFNTTSDYRIKENVNSLSNSYTVDNLRPVSYYNTISKTNDIGFIAHEVQEHFPELVSGEKDAEDRQAINYTGLIGILTKEIQDLKKVVNELRKLVSSSGL